jgi:hypothetical protein
MKKPRPHSSASDKIVLVIVALATLGLGLLAARHDMPQKWHAAILGTVVPFGGAIGALHRHWSLWSFWVSTLICLAMHSVLIWVFFQYVLSGVQTMGMVMWLPIAFLEGFVLLVAITRLEQELGKHAEARIP